MSERGEYRGILTVLLDGPDFQALDAVARWVFLACKLKCGPCGIAVIPGLPHAVAEWTGHDVPAVERALARLEHGDTPWIRRERNMLWIVGGLANEPSRNPRDAKHRASVVDYLAGLPRLALVRRFVREHPEWIEENAAPGKKLAWTAEGDGEGPGGPFEDPSRTLRSTENGERKTETEDGVSATRAASRRRRLVATPAEQAVFAHYKGRHPFSRPGGDDQIRVVRRALAEGYTADELCEAIDGNADEPWCRDRNKHELTFVLRNRDAIDRFRREHLSQSAPGVTADGALSPDTLRLLGAS